MSLFKNIILESTVKDAACGLYHSLAVTSNGQLYSWGNNNYGQLGHGDYTHRSTPTRVGSDSNWASVKSGDYHSIAVKEDGSVYAFGLNNFNQCGVNNQISGNGILQPTLSDAFNASNVVDVYPNGYTTYVKLNATTRWDLSYIGKAPSFTTKTNRTSSTTLMTFPTGAGDPIFTKHGVLVNNTDRITCYGYLRAMDYFTDPNVPTSNISREAYGSGATFGTYSSLDQGRVWYYGKEPRPTEFSSSDTFGAYDTPKQGYLSTAGATRLGTINGSSGKAINARNAIAQTGDLSVFFITADGKLNAQISKTEWGKMWSYGPRNSSYANDKGIVTNSNMFYASYQTTYVWYETTKFDITQIFDRTDLFDLNGGTMNGQGTTQVYDNDKLWSEVYGSRDSLFVKDAAGQFYSAGSPEGNKLGRTITNEKPANQLHPIEIPNVTKVFLGSNHNLFLQSS